MKKHRPVYHILYILALTTSFLIASGTSQAKEVNDTTRKEQFFLHEGTAIQGYDPVSYHQASGPLEGDSKISETHNGIRYHFATEANRKTFQQTPEIYEPLFGGWCAWAMLDGEKVEINPETFKLIDGKLALFYDTFWADTRKKWDKKIAKGIPEKELYKKARLQWAKILD